MEQKEQIILWGLLAISAAFLAAGIVWLVYKYVQTVRFPAKKRKPGIGRLLMFSFTLILSIWFLRFAVELYTGWHPMEGDTRPVLTGVEAFFNSLVHALQTFSMDEAYADYIADGRRMAEALTGVGWFPGFFGIYTALLNVLAPVMGGAALFEILANVFPKLMLYATGMMRWRQRCYFSELNPASLALASSVLQEDYQWWRKPVLIFTDAYLDDDSEKSSEMLLEAKMMGAICLRDDLSTIAKWGGGKRTYYLMDENEVENLRTLAGLANGENRSYIKNADIYLLTHNEAYTQIEKELRQRLQEEFHFRKEELPRLLPVQSYRNLVTNLLVEVPLYEPVVERYRKGKTTELNVTILGSGLIGTEMFLAVYWMGQMLDCRVNICVVSKESPEQFRKKINFINPEILRTVQWEHSDGKDPLLVYNDSGDRGEYYASLRYYRADIATSKPGVSGEVYGFAGEEANCLEHPAVLNSDYIVVALGSDADNISVAEKLRLSVGGAHIRGSKENRHTVIAYVVYNGDLCHTLNEKRHVCSCREGKPDIYMYAFGSLQQVYSCANIMMTRHQLMAELAGEQYTKAQKATDLQTDASERIEKAVYEDGNYNYWANMARAMHLKYKVFSMGWIRSSVFDDTTRDSNTHRRKVVQAIARYKRVALGFPEKGDKEAAAQMQAMAKRLAWLEHRRWNAYTRSRGYRSTDGYGVYHELTGSHKHMSLKLHPCLVECADPAVDSHGPDKLDILADKLVQVGLKRRDFKEYDYPQTEFGSYCDLETAAKRMDCTPEALVARCERGEITGVFRLAGGQWVIPEKFLEQREAVRV